MDTNLFFELLQVALGRREGLSQMPSVREWETLYEESWKQGVAGVLLSGVEKLPEEQMPPIDLKLEWIGEAQIIVEKNREMDQRCVELLEILEKAGLRGTILKGQGIAKLYDTAWKKEDGRTDNSDSLASRRQSGDIDVYVDCGIERAITFARSLGQNDVSWDYKHLHLESWEDTEVEVHYHVEVFFNLIKNRRLQRWFKAHEEMLFEGRCKTDDGKRTLVTPSVELNVFYILLHIYRHYMYTGVGLRQIVDYYFVLRQVSGFFAEQSGRAERKFQGCPSGESAHARDNSNKLGSPLAQSQTSSDILHQTSDIIHQLRMDRFAAGLMWVMREVMAMPREWMPWEPDEREGRYILAQVMEGGNFGHYSSRQTRLTGGLGYVVRVVRHSLHLMRHYPTEALWAPLWVVWHKGWKIRKLWQLRRMHDLDSSNR